MSGTLTEEVGRLTGLGAVVAAESRDAFDLARVTMADPEGNEFAVELSEEELHPSG
ncbi:VOC family protein [Streptomyces sp. NPDC057575]|uniref:VOC family protein n=1 Tax=unclassified Streptomyces TaxID=2593676 RepID=UPI0036B004B4